jgi:hypothetical protein
MLVSLKLGSCVSMPTKRADAILADTLYQVQRSKNRWVQNWEQTNIDRGEEDTPIVWPKYGIARSVCRHVNSQIISTAVHEVSQKLRSKMPWDYKGKSRKFWQGVLNFEIARPTFKGQSFGLHKAIMSLSWEHELILGLSMMSIDSGYRNKRLLWRLHTKELSAGHKRIIRNILDPEHPFAMCCSRLCKTDNAWFLRLVYKDTRELDSVTFRDDNYAMLIPNPKIDERSAFLLISPDMRTRYLLRGDLLQFTHKRLESRRAALRQKYSVDRAGKSHGRQRYFAKQRPLTRGWQNMMDMTRKSVIADVLSMMKKWGCSSLVYREPSMPVRSHDWFAEHNLNWPWSEFEAQLKTKCDDNRIAYLSGPSRRLKLAEFRLMQEKPKNGSVLSMVYETNGRSGKSVQPDKDGAG